MICLKQNFYLSEIVTFKVPEESCDKCAKNTHFLVPSPCILIKLIKDEAPKYTLLTHRCGISDAGLPYWL